MSTTTCIIAIVAAILILAAIVRVIQDSIDHRRASRILRRNGFFDPLDEDHGDRRCT